LQNNEDSKKQITSNTPRTGKFIRGGLANSEKKHENIETPKKSAKSIEKQENPLSELDKYFKKTKTTPVIYYLPLSEEEVKLKEREIEKRKEQKQKQAEIDKNLIK